MNGYKPGDLTYYLDNGVTDIGIVLQVSVVDDYGITVLWENGEIDQYHPDQLGTHSA